MRLNWRRWATAVLAVASGCVAAALGSDDGSEPLYVLYNGKRVPTVIIPPDKAGNGTLRPTHLEVVEVDPETEWSPESVYPTADAPTPGNTDPERDRPAPSGRRSVIGRYAGYPISLPWGSDWDSGYGGYPPEGTARALDEIYRTNESAIQRERERRFNLRDMRQRKERVLASHDKALGVALDHMKRGEYPQAAIALHMAAELDQGDPACRIHLAQAQMALGHYEEAGQALRRALELQSKLLYVSLDLGSYYAKPGEFDADIDKLAAWTQEHRPGPNTYLLLGYMEFQRQKLDAAYAAFRLAARAAPKDTLINSYLKITKPAAK